MSGAESRALMDRLDREAERGGYHLNPDQAFTLGLMDGLLENEARYGYQACPCRLAAGARAEDLDIICPCDYRDPDLAEFGTCYCGLYVSADVRDGKRKLTRIRDRRAFAPSGQRSAAPGRGESPAASPGAALAWPVWRCRVCGYLCARDEPPESCPVCHASKDRFERFM